MKPHEISKYHPDKDDKGEGLWILGVIFTIGGIIFAMGLGIEVSAWFFFLALAGTPFFAMEHYRFRRFASHITKSMDFYQRCLYDSVQTMDADERTELGITTETILSLSETQARDVYNALIEHLEAFRKNKEAEAALNSTGAELIKAISERKEYLQENTKEMLKLAVDTKPSVL